MAGTPDSTSSNKGTFVFRLVQFDDSGVKIAKRKVRMEAAIGRIAVPLDRADVDGLD